MKKLTASTKTTLFIEKARKVHGDKYDYSMVEYKKAIVNVDIICGEHGFFRQTPHGHLSGRGCKVCGAKRRAKIKTYTTDSFIAKAKMVHGDKYSYLKTEYKKSNIKVSILCDIHGLFWQRPVEHLQGRGCPDCGAESAARKRTFSAGIFIKKAKVVHGDKYDYSLVSYINSQTKIIISCKKHGLFNQRPNDHLRGKGCAKCKDTGWSLSKWVAASNQSREFSSYKLYIVLCSSDNETFLKVGRTFNLISTRFSGKKIPYRYRIIDKVIGQAEYIYSTEMCILRSDLLKKYIPKKDFKGQYECFDISELGRLMKWFGDIKEAKKANSVESDIIKGQLSPPFGWD